VKPNLTIYDKLGLLCKNKSGAVSEQLLAGEKWGNVELSFYSLPFPSSHSHSHFYSHETSLAISIPMRIPWDPRHPLELPIYTHLYSNAHKTAKWLPILKVKIFKNLWGQILRIVVNQNALDLVACVSGRKLLGEALRHSPDRKLRSLALCDNKASRLFGGDFSARSRHLL